MGNNFIHLKDMDVRVATPTSKTLRSIHEDQGKLYIYSSFSSDYKLSTLNVPNRYKYLIIGTVPELLYISSILNDFVGYVQFKDFGQNPKISISRLNNIILPDIGESLMAAAAAIELYEGMMADISPLNIESGKERQEFTVLGNFITLIHRYFIQQLYLKDFFESHEIDIISPWIRIISKPELRIMPQNSHPIQFLKSVFSAILEEERDLFDVFNKMKVYQVETYRLLESRLNPDYLGPFLAGV